MSRPWKNTFPFVGSMSPRIILTVVDLPDPFGPRYPSTSPSRRIRPFLPFTALILQSLSFVLFGLLGLRWSSLDSALRCQHCLCSLASPARVGRPSWNFLEFNGTELTCKHGHGHLSIPEIETSWHQSSVWIATN